VVMVLWALGAVALLICFLWNAHLYWAATIGVEPKDSVASPPEVSNLPPEGNTWAILRRQGDPVIESLRRRVWLAFAAWLLYALLGDAFWRVLVG
jgi:hypothetical protein